MSNELYDRVAALLAGCPDGYAPVVATDADGTLWSDDVGDALYHDWLAHLHDGHEGAGVVNEAAARYLPAAPALSLAARARALVAPGVLSHEALCELEARALGGCSHAQLEALVTAVGQRFVSRVRPAVRETLEALRAQGLAVVVVSASLSVVVEAALRAAELPFDAVLAAQLVSREGALGAELAGPIPMFEGKVRALRAHGAWPPRVALGDSPLDAPFLLGAWCAVEVHPRPALREALLAHPRRVLWTG